MPRRQRGHPGETEPPENADHEGPAPADLLQMWITGRQPQRDRGEPRESRQPGDNRRASLGRTDSPDRRGRLPERDDRDRESTPVEDEPETVAEPAPEPATGADPAQGWASFGHARTAEDVLERSDRNPWLDVLLGETAAPPHPPAEPAKPALLRELDHDDGADRGGRARSRSRSSPRSRCSEATTRTRARSSSPAASSRRPRPSGSTSAGRRNRTTPGRTHSPPVGGVGGLRRPMGIRRRLADR